MAVKEVAKNMRTALKEELGITSKEVSVRVGAHGSDHTIAVTIKSLTAPYSAVESVAKRFEKIDVEELTGEILAGCNIFVSVRYKDGLLDRMKQERVEEAKRALATIGTREARKLRPTLWLVDNGYDVVVRDYITNPFGGRCVKNDPEGLAGILARFDAEHSAPRWWMDALAEKFKSSLDYFNSSNLAEREERLTEDYSLLSLDRAFTDEVKGFAEQTGNAIITKRQAAAYMLARRDLGL